MKEIRNALCVNTAFEHLGVCLMWGGEVFYNHFSHARKRNDRRIFSAVEEALDSVGGAPADLDGAAVVSGPGNYTGLRIGMAMVKTLAQVGGVPLVGVASLDLLAAQVEAAPGERFQVLLNCTRAEVFHAEYLMGPGGPAALGAPRLAEMAELAPALAGAPAHLKRLPSATSHKYAPAFEGLRPAPLRHPAADAQLALLLALPALRAWTTEAAPVLPTYIKKDA